MQDTPPERPSRTRGPSPAKTAETQGRICAAALNRFLSEGFERTRMLDVARDAGLAKGTLYLYFPTKEALFEGVLTQLLGDTVARLEVSPPGEGEATSAYLKRVLAPLLSDDRIQLRLSLFRLIIFEGGRFPELLAAYRRVVLEPMLATARRLSQRARARGEMVSDALERLPMLLLAPGLVVTVWNQLFPEEK
ncbi:MAG: TetR/AcrR family transcriptional regulator, partial [Rhodobacteraceae bacterium]|nr:TetR/AcrR family transcriptional regulator [Paracoccaceae bacterium]